MGNQDRRSTMNHCAFPLLSAMTLLALCCPASRAQSSAPDPYQALMDQGVTAAAKEDYAAALTRFTQACEIRCSSPPLLLDLGLASSKIPGHDLRTIAWFEAYLHAQPDVTTAIAVRQQTAVLQSAYAAKLSDTLDGLELLWKRNKAYPINSLASPGESPIVLKQRTDEQNKILKETGWLLASSRYLLGESKQGERFLEASDGPKWRNDAASEAMQHNTLVDHLVESMVAAGQFDDTMSLETRISSPDVVNFALERGAASRAKILIDKGSYNSLRASACFAAASHDRATFDDAVAHAAQASDPADPPDRSQLVDLVMSVANEAASGTVPGFDAAQLHQQARDLAQTITDATEREKAEGYLKRTQATSYDPCDNDFLTWAGRGRSNYLFGIGYGGVIFIKTFADDPSLDDTRLVDYIRNVAVDDGIYDHNRARVQMAMLNFFRLVEAFRKVHGPFD